MPKSKKSNKKNGKQESKAENQWVHVEEEPHPDSWEMVDDTVTQDVTGKISDDDLIVILEENCQQPGGLSLVTQASPVESCKGFPKGKFTEQSTEDSPESELDRSSDFQIIENSEDGSSCDSDLLLEAEIMEAAKQNGSLKYSHIVQQIPPPATSLFPDVTYSGLTGKSPASMKQDESLALVSSDADNLKSEKQSKKVIQQPLNTENQSPCEKDLKEPKNEEAATVIKMSEIPKESKPARVEHEENEGENFIVQKSKKQKKNKKKKQALSVEDAPEESSESSEGKSSLKEEQVEEEPVKKEYFQTFTKDKGARDLTTLSVLLSRDQTVEDLTEEVQDNHAQLNLQSSSMMDKVSESNGALQKQRDSFPLEAVPEVQVAEDTESTGGTEETASIAGTEDSSEKAESVKGNDQSPPQPGEKKISKSARRRKKLKEKMAKAIESFSNPELLIEKYEKSFGEDYDPPSQVIEAKIDNSVTCPVCLELYHQPYLVQPCGHIFCEPCLRKLTTKSCLDVPCPLCRKIIQSCHFDNELSHQITKSFPVKSAARNRAERKSKTKKNPLPGSQEQQNTQSAVSRVTGTGGRKAPRGANIPFSHATLQRILLVFIGMISYIFTSITIRAITYFDLNSNNSTSYIFILILFCLYFYFVDKGVKKLQNFIES